MEEKRVFFGSSASRLEGLYGAADSDAAAVISHPYPPMGGNMDNPIVEIITRTLFTNGIATLRFNFRGVGRSSGMFDNGKGEQEDVLAAIAFLEEQGLPKILLAGYSFGAWVNAHIMTGRTLSPAIFVAPPIHLFAFDFSILRGKVGLIVCGDQDDYCPSEGARKAAVEIACPLDIIPGADHFFSSCEHDFAASINNYAAKLKPGI